MSSSNSKADPPKPKPLSPPPPAAPSTVSALQPFKFSSGRHPPEIKKDKNDDKLPFKGISDRKEEVEKEKVKIKLQTLTSSSSSSASLSSSLTKGQAKAKPKEDEIGNSNYKANYEGSRRKRRIKRTLNIQPPVTIEIPRRHSVLTKSHRLIGRERSTVLATTRAGPTIWERVRKKLSGETIDDDSLSKQRQSQLQQHSSIKRRWERVASSEKGQPQKKARRKGAKSQQPQEPSKTKSKDFDTAIVGEKSKEQTNPNTTSISNSNPVPNQSLTLNENSTKDQGQEDSRSIRGHSGNSSLVQTNNSSLAKGPSKKRNKRPTLLRAVLRATTFVNDPMPIEMEMETKAKTEYKFLRDAPSSFYQRSERSTEQNSVLSKQEVSVSTSIPGPTTVDVGTSISTDDGFPADVRGTGSKPAAVLTVEISTSPSTPQTIQEQNEGAQGQEPKGQGTGSQGQNKEPGSEKSRSKKPLQEDSWHSIPMSPPPEHHYRGRRYTVANAELAQVEATMSGYVNLPDFADNIVETDLLEIHSYVKEMTTKLYLFSVALFLIASMLNAACYFMYNLLPNIFAIDVLLRVFILGDLNRGGIGGVIISFIILAFWIFFVLAIPNPASKIIRNGRWAFCGVIELYIFWCLIAQFYECAHIRQKIQDAMILDLTISKDSQKPVAPTRLERFTQGYFQCCGIKGYEDWQSFSHLNRTWREDLEGGYPESCCNKNFPECRKPVTLADGSDMEKDTVQLWEEPCLDPEVLFATCTISFVFVLEILTFILTIIASLLLKSVISHTIIHNVGHDEILHPFS